MKKDEIRHFPLPGLLPEGQVFALNMHLGTLSQLGVSPDQQPRIIREQRFTESEVCILVPLLSSYPHFCPYELLHASFNSHDVTKEQIVRSRERLHQTQEEGLWEYEMLPIRNMLSRVRLKLRDFGLDITSIHEVGYILLGDLRILRGENSTPAR